MITKSIGKGSFGEIF